MRNMQLQYNYNIILALLRSTIMAMKIDYCPCSAPFFVSVMVWVGWGEIEDNTWWVVFVAAAVLYFPFPLFPFDLPCPEEWWCGLGWWTPLDLYLWVCRGVPGICGIILVMFPTAFVLPSLNTMRVPGWRNSGFLMKRNRHEALSPVRRCSLFMEMIEAVCLVLPQWTAQSNV